MRCFKLSIKTPIGSALAVALATTCLAAAAPVAAAPGASATSNTVVLSTGRGRLVNLSQPMSDVFVADDDIADVQVRSPTQLYIFAKKAGETTVHATSRSGATIYSTAVRVGNNSETIDQMLKVAMPEAAIEATPMNGLVLLTGTVPNPEESAEAERLVQAFVGPETQVVSRLRTATPLQVNLQVRIAEVSRTLAKEIGFNLLAQDFTSGFTFGLFRGTRPGGFPTDPLGEGFAGTTVPGFPALADGKYSISAAGRLLGLDLATALDLFENDGLVTTLANPNLTALSGETASFLAGGEFPVPISQALGTISIEYKQYGVSLSFTPTVLADGRISMRVRPEVSELAIEGAIRLNGFNVPALTTRRAETTVELGSGQSFMIGGLLRNAQTNVTDKAPWLGDLPILGTLFRSNNFRRNESELMIIVTPYLVKPVSTQLQLPTDGYRSPTDAQRVFGGAAFDGESGAKRPAPTAVRNAPVTSRATTPQPQLQQQAQAGGKAQSAAPGFSIQQ